MTVAPLSPDCRQSFALLRREGAAAVPLCEQAGAVFRTRCCAVAAVGGCRCSASRTRAIQQKAPAANLRLVPGTQGEVGLGAGSAGREKAPDAAPAYLPAPAGMRPWEKTMLSKLRFREELVKLCMVIPGWQAISLPTAISILGRATQVRAPSRSSRA
jgi:hypothetical protein